MSISRVGSARKALLALSVLLVAGAAVYGWRLTRSPRYSLFKAAMAAHDHDVATFRKYVDVPSVATSLVDAMADEALRGRPASDDASRPGFARRLLVPVLERRLATVVEERIVAYVETGSLPIGAAYRAVEGIRTEGDSAYVELNLEPIVQDSVLVELAMRDRGGYWQVTQVTRLEGIAVLESAGQFLRSLAPLLPW